MGASILAVEKLGLLELLCGQPIRTGLRLLLPISIICIIRCDVETNPGPVVHEFVTELGEFRASSDLNFDTLKGENW